MDRLLAELLEVAGRAAGWAWRRGWCRRWGEREDLVQEGHLVALACRARPDLDPARARDYVWVAVRNRLRGLHRRALRGPVADAHDLPAEVVGPSPDPEDAAVAAELGGALARLPEAQAGLLRARYGLGCRRRTLGAVARREGLTRQAMHARERKALAALRTALGEAACGRVPPAGAPSGPAEATRRGVAAGGASQL